MCVTSLTLSLTLVGVTTKSVSQSYQQRAEEVLIRVAEFEETEYQDWGLAKGQGSRRTHRVVYSV